MGLECSGGKQGIGIKVDGIEREVCKVWRHVVNVKGFNEEIKVAPGGNSRMVGGGIPSYTTGYQKELIIKMLFQDTSFLLVLKETLL